jgi:L-amino acid N-acyltransferase YncA
MKTIVRSARIEDLEAILAIVNDAILNTTAIYDYDVRTLNEQISWFQEKKEQNFPVIVATDENDNVVGFGTYGTFRMKIGFKFTVEHSVYVKEGFAGNGIGKAILLELINLAKAQKLHVMVGCIDAENTGSIEFHEKFGFKKAGILKESGYKFDKWLDLQFVQLII